MTKIATLARLCDDLAEKKLMMKQFRDIVREEMESMSNFPKLDEDLTELKNQMKALRETALDSSGQRSHIEDCAEETKQIQEDIDVLVASMIAEGDITPGVPMDMGGKKIFPSISVKLKQMKMEL